MPLLLSHWHLEFVVDIVQRFRELLQLAALPTAISLYLSFRPEGHLDLRHDVLVLKLAFVVHFRQSASHAGGKVVLHSAP